MGGRARPQGLWSAARVPRWSQSTSGPLRSPMLASRGSPVRVGGAGPDRGGVGGPHLICAPTPGGQYREPENEAWPRDVPVYRVPKHVEGIGPGEVTGGVGDCGVGDGLPVPLLQAWVPAHLLKACGERAMGEAPPGPPLVPATRAPSAPVPWGVPGLPRFGTERILPPPGGDMAVCSRSSDQTTERQAKVGEGNLGARSGCIQFSPYPET